MVFQSLVKLSKYCLMLALFSPTPLLSQQIRDWNIDFL